jgi:hypothetical protein
MGSKVEIEKLITNMWIEQDGKLDNIEYEKDLSLNQ